MTETIYNNFTPESSLSMQRQITMFLRDAINTGKLKAEDKLPSSRSLAQIWDTNYFTVNSALKVLVQEGILTQKPRVGTIVKRRTSKLQKVGIYFTGKGIYDRESYFYLVIQNKIQNELAEHGAQSMVFIDERKEKDMNCPMTELQQAISDGKIDCLIAPRVNGTAMRWLETLSIPRVALSANETSFSVTFDTECRSKLIIERFKELNVKSIGIITSVSSDYNSDGTLSFVGLLKKKSREYGLEFREEWSICPDTEPSNLMEFGYTGHKRLNCLQEKPEGLVLYPDVIAIGAINSIMETGIKIPEEMKIILHQNSQHDMFTPFKADIILSDPGKVARLMVDKLVNDTTSDNEPKLSIYKTKLIKKY